MECPHARMARPCPLGGIGHLVLHARLLVCLSELPVISFAEPAWQRTFCSLWVYGGGAGMPLATPYWPDLGWVSSLCALRVVCSPHGQRCCALLRSVTLVFPVFAALCLIKPACCHACYLGTFCSNVGTRTRARTGNVMSADAVDGRAGREGPAPRQARKGREGAHNRALLQVERTPAAPLPFAPSLWPNP